MTVRPSPAAGGSFHHLGVLVQDIRAARRTFVAELGVRFTEIATVEFEVVLPDAEESYMRVSEVAFSRDGPPYYELVQVGDDRHDRLFGRDELGHIHHVGRWVDAAQAMVDFRSRGLRVAAEIRAPGAMTRAWYSDPVQTFGIRWEFQDMSRQPWIDEFIATGRVPVG
jgi:catechol 2,3-dioxygenase-like lactoylglutathione lyase family enzyme